MSEQRRKLSERSSRPKVHIRRIDPQAAEAVMGGLVGDLLADDMIPGVARVVIKINLCEYRRPESGAVTDPVMLQALVGALKARLPGRPVLIAESDATSLDAESAFRYMSIDRVAERMGATLVNFSKAACRLVPLPEGRIFKEMKMPDVLAEDTLYVNFAKLKINSGTRITGCLKNNYALIPVKNKAQFHGVVEDAIHDVNCALARTGVRHLCVIDGYIGMETIGGPAFGRPRKCGLILGSIDPVAIDACEARVIGMNPRSVTHVGLCARAGLGSMAFVHETDIPGFSYAPYKFKFESLQYWLRQRVKKFAGIGL